MADFYPAALQIQQPDLLGSYLRGQAGALAATQGQQNIAQGQQELEAGGLKLEQLRMALQQQKMLFGYAQQLADAGQGAQNSGAPTGGIQNGPQGAVSGSGPQSGPQYDVNDPLGPLLDPRRVATNAAFGQMSAIMSGKDPNTATAEALKLQTDARNAAIEKAKLMTEIPSANNPMPMFKSFAQLSPDEAGAALAKNPQLMSAWPSLAQQYGVDPWDKSKIPVVAAMEYNKRGAPLGLSVAVPQQLRNVNLGQGEVGQINEVTGKKEGDLIERQIPGYTLVDKYDPATNTTTKVPVQTSGFGMGGVNPASGQPVGTGTVGGFNAGMKAPTDPEFKAAMFASEMRSGMNTMQKLEDQGFNLSPKTRALVINAATSEDSGVLRQLLSQEMLVHGMTPKEQTYIAGLMPMLQAAGHDQSGARLTTAQIRQNVESLLPVDVRNKTALKQVQENRQGFYTGLLTQAGSAAQLPQYKSTLASDLQNAQNQAGVTRTINGKTYTQRNGKWYAD